MIKKQTYHYQNETYNGKLYIDRMPQL